MLFFIGITAPPQNLRVVVDRKEVEFAKGVSRPRIINGRAYARVCSLSEAVGAKMFSDFTQDKVVIDRGEQHLEIPLRSGADGEQVAIIVRGEGFFPIRQVMTALGDQVYWDFAARAFHIRRAKLN